MKSVFRNDKSIIAEKSVRTLKSKICWYMASISKNVYSDKLDGIVDKYNKHNHSIIKMKPVDINWRSLLLIIKILNLKLVVLLEYQNMKIFLQKDMFQIPNWSEEVFVMKKVKKTLCCESLW